MSGDGPRVAMSQGRGSLSYTRGWTAHTVIILCALVIVSIVLARTRTVVHPISRGAPVPSWGMPQAKGVYLGISVHQWTTADMLTNLRRYEARTGKRAAMVMYWRDWSRAGTVDPGVMKAIYAQGSVPVVSWEPGSYATGPQPKYSLEAIIAGRWDRYIRAFAHSLASYHRGVFLRFAHEMNGNWYQWGGRPKQFVAAWRHVHDIFRQAGATRVYWVWCANVNWDRRHPFGAYYPGNAYVDWVGLDGYNRPRTGWNSFATVFRSSYEAIVRLSDKPVMIGETGTAEPTRVEAAMGDSKAGWITDMYRRAVPSMPRIKAVVWFDVDKSARDANGHAGYDNRIATSAGAERAFAYATGLNFYRSSWP